MKKLILFLILLSSVAYSQISPVNVGSAANDRTGDQLRTAFQKLNANDVYLDEQGVQRLDSLLDAGVSSGGLQVITTAGINTLTATVDGVTSYDNGDAYLLFIGGGVNTGPVTLNINSIGSRNLYKLPATTGLQAGDLQLRGLYLIVYDSNAAFGTGAFKIAGDGYNMTKFLPNSGVVGLSEPLQFQAYDVLTMGTSLGSEFRVERNPSTGDDQIQVLDINLSGEAAGFIGDLGNMSGLGHGFYFGDFRTVPKGLQYYGVGYEDTGNDSTLISKGWANSKFWKTSGTTSLTGNTSISSGTSKFNIDIGDTEIGYGKLAIRNNVTGLLSYPVTGAQSGLLMNANITTLKHASTTDPDIVASLVFNTTGGIMLTDQLLGKGIEYASDYSANFSDRSLVDWGNVWKVKGNTTITEPVTITSDENGGIELIMNDGIFDTRSSLTLNAFSSEARLQTIGNVSGSQSVSNLSTTVDGIFMQVYEAGPILSTQLEISSNAVKFTDSRTVKKGIEYAADYSSDFTSRSIVDKAYVQNLTLEGSATLDFPSTTSAAVARLTITVTGAALSDPVSLGIPNGSVTATGTYSAWVSAANTVTVQFSPKATEDPASGTFKVTVHKP